MDSRRLNKLYQKGIIGDKENYERE